MVEGQAAPATTTAAEQSAAQASAPTDQTPSPVPDKEQGPALTAQPQDTESEDLAAASSSECSAPAENSEDAGGGSTGSFGAVSCNFRVRLSIRIGPLP